METSNGMNQYSDSDLEIRKRNEYLEMELGKQKSKIKSLEEQNTILKGEAVKSQAMAEQEEEFISNKLFRKINLLKKEKERLAQQYEEEEESMTNCLQDKLMKLQKESSKVERNLQQEQESLVENLVRKIEKLETEISVKQYHLENVRKEKIDLENVLEKEQEAFVNRLWQKMEKLEAEKEELQKRLNLTPSVPDLVVLTCDNSTKNHVKQLKGEVRKLKSKLDIVEREHEAKLKKLEEEEKLIMEENEKLLKKLEQYKYNKYENDGTTSTDDSSVGALKCPTCGHELQSFIVQD